MQQKKLPQRTCIVCRKSSEKQDFYRIVRTPEGSYDFDATLKKNGRGAYICKDDKCIEKCFNKKMLNKTFKTNIPDEIYEKLKAEYNEFKN